MNTRTRSCALMVPLAIALLSLGGCGNSYDKQAGIRMRDICAVSAVLCKDGLLVLERPPQSAFPTLLTPLLEIQRFHCDDQSQNGTSLRVTAHVLNFGSATFDNVQPVNLVATLSDDGQRVLKSAVGTMGPHTQIVPYSQAQQGDPQADIAVRIDFGDVSGTTVREVTVSFDPNAWTGIVRLNNGALSWPVWNNAAAVSQTPVDLTAQGSCSAQVPGG
ncbi:MAG TPA: hypothetical protein VMT66_10965 [Steroidobacteraceae bacterium]|nr:hypothetical protein [Steroidobacteraceae bacterium]